MNSEKPPNSCGSRILALALKDANFWNSSRPLKALLMPPMTSDKTQRHAEAAPSLLFDLPTWSIRKRGQPIDAHNDHGSRSVADL